MDHLVENYDGKTKEKKKKTDKPKEKSTKEETSRWHDKAKTKKLLECWIC